MHLAQKSRREKAVAVGVPLFEVAKTSRVDSPSRAAAGGSGIPEARAVT